MYIYKYRLRLYKNLTYCKMAMIRVASDPRSSRTSAVQRDGPALMYIHEEAARTHSRA